jgi:RNAse (barnase) inhibitor barstar
MTTIFGMGEALAARDERAAGDVWHNKADNLYDSALLLRSTGMGATPAEQDDVPEGDQEGAMNLFKTVRPNIVQSIRAFRVPELAQAAADLGQHFLYANCANATTKVEVLDTIATEFLFPRHFGKNFDALGDCLTDMVYKAGPQPGFVIVLEGLPCTQKFDKEAREVLLDVFRDAAEFWGERKVQFRVFYSFA